MENWKQIDDYPCYMISNLGRIKSLKFNKEKILKGGIDTRGYHHVPLRNEKGRKGLLTHRLVAKAFVLNLKNTECVNHLNGIKTDNRAENLEWCTQKENVNHAWASDLCGSKVGNLNGRSILNEIQVVEIRSLTGMRVSEIAAKYNASWSCISKVLKRQTWSHI